MSVKNLAYKTDSRKRNALYDNVKYLLILLVIIGHMIEPYAEPSVEGHDDIRYLFLMIYMFHMPLFYFISGLFQKKFSKERGIPWNKVLNLLIIFYLYKCLNYVRNIIIEKPSAFHFFWEDGIPWFVFVMAAFLILMYLFRKVPPVILIPVNIVIVCIAGYFVEIGDMLCISRILVYFPFYVLGYHLTPEQVLKFTRHKVIRPLCILALVGVCLLCVWKFDFIYPLRHLFTGRNPFNEWDYEHGTWRLRLLCYLLTSIEGLGVIALLPNVKIPLFSWIGQQTMRIYFWHLIFIKILLFKGFGDWLVSLGNLQYPAYLLAGIFFTIIFSLPIFGIPTDYVMKWKLLPMKDRKKRKKSS